MTSRAPFKSSHSRVWLIESRARVDHEPEFFNFLKMTAIDKALGSVNPIYEPSKAQYGEFDQTGEFRDEEERPTTSLAGRYAINVKSRLLELAMRKCAIDMQLHMGSCSAPGIFNEFQKVMIWEGVNLETYGTEDMGALEPGENSKVDETGDISATRMYEYVPVKLSPRTPTGVTTEIVDVAMCDNPSCGDCAEPSDGCQKIVAVTVAAGGSPGTPPDIVFSLDGAATWISHDIDSLATAIGATGIRCIAGYAVAIAATAGTEMHIVDTDRLNSWEDPLWTQVTTGFAGAGAEPNAIDSVGNLGYIVGNGGYIYKTSDPPSGVTVVDAGAATLDHLRDVDMLSDEFAVAVGDNGAIVVIDNDNVSSAIASPVGFGIILQAVLVVSEEEWLVGADDGTLWYTLDAGITWTQITLAGTQTAITDIVQSSDSIIWVSATVGGQGEIYVSIDGGYTFTQTPRSASNAMPANTGINALAVCPFDVDFVVGVGLAADGTDGFIVVGAD